MLHALIGRKAKLQVFRHAGARLPLEDVVTSTVFGPLAFLRDEDRLLALTELLEALGARRPDWSAPPAPLFWPVWRITDDHEFRSRSVEPDIVFDHAGARLVVEIKWGAPLGDYELAAQWSAQSAAARAVGVHLLIVRDLSAYEASIKADRNALRAVGISAWPFHAVTWRNLGEAAERLSRRSASGSVRSWAAAVCAFLLNEEARVQQGWIRLQLATPGVVAWRVSKAWFTQTLPTPATTWSFR